MSKSGAGALIADTAVNLLGEHPNKSLVLFIILVLVTLLTNAMMNTSCAMLVTPLFIPIVQAFGMNTTAVAIAICVAGSAPDPGGQRHQHPDRPSGQPEVHGLLPPRPGADGGHSHRIHDLHSHFLASVSDF